MFRFTRTPAFPQKKALVLVGKTEEKDPDVDGRKILECIYKRWDVGMD
jgi:hypothetical protein